MSIPFGLIDLYRKFVSAIYPDEKEAKDIRRYASKRFDEAGLPEDGVYSTAVIVGATGAAIYDIYAEFSDEKLASDVRTIRRKKFKKLVDHLLTGEDRSRLVLNNAPEKLYLIGSAAIVLKLLFKRFDVENIIVSERGVKEGYLRLVLEGKESGAYYDFVRGGADGEARKLPEAKEPEKKTKSTAKRKGAKPSEKAKKGTSDEKRADAEKPAKRRGRPKKTAQEVTEPVQAQPAQETAPSKPAKHRGRPKKTAQEVTEPVQTQPAQETEPSKSAKRRGRPKKSAAEKSEKAIEEGAEKAKTSESVQAPAEPFETSVREAAVESSQASADKTSGADETKAE